MSAQASSSARSRVWLVNQGWGFEMRKYFFETLSDRSGLSLVEALVGVSLSLVGLSFIMLGNSQVQLVQESMKNSSKFQSAFNLIQSRLMADSCSEAVLPVAGASKNVFAGNVPISIMINGSVFAQSYLPADGFTFVDVSIVQTSAPTSALASDAILTMAFQLNVSARIVGKPDATAVQTFTGSFFGEATDGNFIRCVGAQAYQLKLSLETTERTKKIIEETEYVKNTITRLKLENPTITPTQELACETAFKKVAPALTSYSQYVTLAANTTITTTLAEYCVTATKTKEEFDLGISGVVHNLGQPQCLAASPTSPTDCPSAPPTTTVGCLDPMADQPTKEALYLAGNARVVAAGGAPCHFYYDITSLGPVTYYVGAVSDGVGKVSFSTYAAALAAYNAANPTKTVVTAAAEISACQLSKKNPSVSVAVDTLAPCVIPVTTVGPLVAGK
jgi:hypothetical protein